MGYTAGIQPSGEWRYFSWHPFLMTTGMVGLSGIGAVTKKMGGYTNTKVRNYVKFMIQTKALSTKISAFDLISLVRFISKLHGIIGWLSIFTSVAGCYVIYNNKQVNGYKHMMSSHSWLGLGVIINCIGLGMAGGIFLHPDFGIAQTNKTLRNLHKWAARITLIGAWVTAFLGLNQLIPTDSNTMAMYGFPLVLLVPFTLM